MTLLFNCATATMGFEFPVAQATRLYGIFWMPTERYWEAPQRYSPYLNLSPGSQFR